jgi:pimeloyl-ACP methyl ester carboxylesterase
MEPVVVLHGGPGAPGSVATLAEAVADEFTVSEPWQRRSGDEPLTVAGHFADLAAVVEGRVHVVGWSWGAMLGLSFATAHPEHVRSLVLVGCGTYDEVSREEYEASMRERLGPAARTRAADLSERLVARTQGYDPLDDDRPPVAVDVRGHEETWADVPLRRHIPQLDYVELARCGHAPWLERHAREEFLRYIRTWLHAH